MYLAHEQFDGARSLCPGGPSPAAATRAPARGLHGAAIRLSGRLMAWREQVETRCRTIDLAPDLAEEIGSRRWFRGLGTMTGLCVAALSLWPDLTAVEAATTSASDPAVRDEFRAQMIVPLALGGESGRHMGPTAAVAPAASVPERPMIQLAATLAQGDSLGRMLQRAGVGAADADTASRLIAAAVPPGEIEPGTRFDLTLGKRAAQGGPRPLDRLGFRARFDLKLSLDRRGGALVLDRQPITIDTTPLRIRGLVGDSLYRSARASGAPIGAIQQYLQALDAHLSLEGDVAPDDSFDMIFAYKRSSNGESQLGDLLFAGLETAGKPRVQLLRWGKDGQFFDVAGAGRQSSAVLAGPVAGRITSLFGLRRHPILGYTRMHAGVDFAAAWGAPVHAVSSGLVTYAGWHGGHGNFVRLDHGGGLGTGYGHMSRIAVAPGTHVNAGQVIGYVGSTGLSTGPHLHYELYRNGRAVDPLSVRFAVQSQFDARELAAFKAKLTELRKIAPGAALGNFLPKQLARKFDRSGK